MIDYNVENGHITDYVVKRGVLSHIFHIGRSTFCIGGEENINMLYIFIYYEYLFTFCILETPFQTL